MAMTRNFPKLLLRGVLSLLVLLALLPAGRPAQADDFLDPEQAFKLSVKALDERALEVSFEIAPGDYMYREQFKVEAQGATLGEPEIPDGKTKFDETFQKTGEVYRELLRVRLPVTEPGGACGLSVAVQAGADQGLCYPPMTQS